MRRSRIILATQTTSNNMNKNAQALGSLGGKASAKKLTKEERIKRAKMAIKARWDKKKLSTPIHIV